MKHDDTTLQAAIDAAMIEIGRQITGNNFAASLEYEASWPAEQSDRLALAKAFLAKLDHFGESNEMLPQPIQADDSRSLGQVAFEAAGWSHKWEEAPSIQDKWQRASQAVVAAARPAIEAECLVQAVRRMEAVPVKEIWKTFNRTKSLKEVRSCLIAAARGEAVGINGLTETEEAQTASVAGLSKPDSTDWKARAEKAEAALAESEKQFQAKVTELLETLGRAEKAEKEVELLKKVPLRQMVQQLEREVNHWCDLHAVTYNRAEKAEAELAALKSSQIGILRPLAEAGPVPDGCARILGYRKTDGQWALAIWDDEYDTHFADIRLPSNETPEQTANEQPKQQVPLGPEEKLQAIKDILEIK